MTTSEGLPEKIWMEPLDLLFIQETLKAALLEIKEHQEDGVKIKNQNLVKILEDNPDCDLFDVRDDDDEEQNKIESYEKMTEEVVDDLMFQ